MRLHWFHGCNAKFEIVSGRQLVKLNHLKFQCVTLAHAHFKRENELFSRVEDAIREIPIGMTNSLFCFCYCIVLMLLHLGQFTLYPFAV